MKRKISWGVIGSGGIARRRTIPEGMGPARNGVLKAVYDLDPAVNAAVAAQFKARPAASIEELLAGDIDAVYIATPANAHAAQAEACRRAGKHVLCEKPLGLTAAQVRRMTESFKASGLLLAPAFMMRFQSQHVQAREWIRQGRLGTPVYARAQLSCWYPPMKGAWRQDPALGGGGSLMDLGGHCIDLLELFLGPAAEVRCLTAGLVHKYAVEDSATVLLRFASGAQATVDTFFCIPDFASRNRLELYGSAGAILAEGTIGQGSAGVMRACLGKAGGYDAKQARASAKGIDVKPRAVNLYRAEVEAFGDAVLAGKLPGDWAQAGLRSQLVLDACYRSAKSGRTVKLSG
jgi:predicted dehydrogenase